MGVKQNQQERPETVFRFVVGHAWLLVSLGVITAIWLGSWTDGILGHPYGDMPDHIWGNEWFAQELRQGRWPRWVQHNYFPDGGVLWHIDPVGALFRRIFLFLPPHWVWNTYLWVLLCGFATTVYYWGSRLGATKAQALLLGILSITSPYFSGLVHSGLTEYMGLGFGVCFVLALHQRKWVWSGVWLMILGVQSFVVGILGALYGALYLLMHTRETTAVESGYRLLCIALPSACIVLPLGWMCLETLTDPQAAFAIVDAPGWNFRMLPTVDIVGFLPIGDWVHPDTRHVNPGIVQNHSFGWGWMCLVIFGAVQSWRMKKLALHKPFFGYALLALGPRLSIARWMPFGGWVLLPLALLYVPFSPFRWVHHPYHMVMFVWISSIPLVVDAVKRLPVWGWCLVIVLTAVETQTGSVPYPLVRTQFVEDCSVEGARLDFPPDHSTANRQYLIQQLRHREPIAYGVNQWMPESVFIDPGMQRWLRLLDDPIRRSQNRDQPPERIRWPRASSESHQLDRLGFQWFVVHLEFLSTAEIARLRPILHDELGEATIESDVLWVYPLEK